MYKNEMDKHRRNLRFELLKYGLLVIIWVCFLIYQITRVARDPPLYGKSVSPVIFSFAVLIILIAIAGVRLYRQATSYIRWYQGIFDSIPIPVIATDKDAAWRQANKMALEAVNARQEQGVEELNSRHLIGEDGNVMKRKWIRGTTEYKVEGNPLRVDGEDVGHIILFYNMSELTESSNTRAELIDEINRLLGRLSDAKVHFDGCARSLAGYTTRQAGIIHELSDVIVGIASGVLNEPGELNKKMGAVKEQMRSQVECSQQQIDKIRRTVGDLEATHESINGVLRDIDNVP